MRKKERETLLHVTEERVYTQEEVIKRLKNKVKIAEDCVEAMNTNVRMYQEEKTEARTALEALAKITGIHDNYTTTHTKEQGHWEDDLERPTTKRVRKYRYCYCSISLYNYYRCNACMYPEYETVPNGFEQKWVVDAPKVWTTFDVDLLMKDLAAVQETESTEEARKRLTPKRKPATKRTAVRK